MTDVEQHQLNQRLAQALDAAGLGEYAWEWQFPSNAMRYGKEPKDFADATALMAALEAWEHQDEDQYRPARYWVLHSHSISGETGRCTDSLAFVAGCSGWGKNPLEALARAFLAVLTATTAGAAVEATDDAGQ